MYSSVPVWSCNSLIGCIPNLWMVVDTPDISGSREKTYPGQTRLAHRATTDPTHATLNDV